MGEIRNDALDGLLASGPAVTHAPTMGALDKVRYSHQDMIDFIIAKGRVTNRELAARYGYSESWISNVMASDAWQAAMAARREEIVDPALKLSIDERFRGMATRSLERLMEKLDAPQVSDQVVLRAVELGAKAIGIGGNAPLREPAADHLAQLANRLIDLQAKVRRESQGVTYEGQVSKIPQGVLPGNLLVEAESTCDESQAAGGSTRADSGRADAAAL